MRARDQSSIFSTGGKFRPDYGLLLELHALTLVLTFTRAVHTATAVVAVDVLRRWCPLLPDTPPTSLIDHIKVRAPNDTLGGLLSW